MNRVPGGGWALLLDCRPGLRVLALGEPAASVDALRARGAQVTACDVAELEKLPFASFDLALLRGGGARIEAALERVYRVLVAGGGLVLVGSIDRAKVERAGFEEVRIFATLRDEEHPKYLVPLDHPGAARYFFDAIAPRRPGALDRIRVRGAATLTRLGLLGRIAPGRHVLAVKPSGGDEATSGALVEPWLRAEAVAVIGAARAADLHFVIIIGWKEDATTLTALAFDAGALRPAFVAKVATGASATEAAVLRRNLEILARAFEGEATAPVPRLLGSAERPWATVVFESVLEGRPLHVPDSPGALRALAFQASEWLLELHRRTGPGSLMLEPATVERLLIRPFDRYRARFRPGPQEAGFLEQTARHARELAAHPFPLVLAHGDFCPPNLVAQGRRLGVLDWEAPLEPTLPAQDLIHFLACLGDYEEVFFSSGSHARIARDVLLAYAQSLGLSVATLEALFAIFWIDYAVEKVEMQGTSRAGDEHLWGLVRLEGETCWNVERLARAQGDLFLRMR